MFIRSLPITLLQIFCNIILNSKVIVKVIIDVAEISRGTLNPYAAGV